MQPDFNSHNQTEGHFIWPRAKGCDHEIVRALETHLKAVPWTFEMVLDFVWSHAYKCSVKTYVIGLSMKCYSLPSFHVGSSI